MTKNLSEEQFKEFIADKFCYTSVVNWYEQTNLVERSCNLFSIEGIVTSAPLDRYAVTHSEKCRGSHINGTSMWDVGFWRVKKTLVRRQPRYYLTETK